jgi:hypothetical protein
MAHTHPNSTARPQVAAAPTLCSARSMSILTALAAASLSSSLLWKLALGADLLRNAPTSPPPPLSSSEAAAAIKSNRLNSAHGEATRSALRGDSGDAARPLRLLSGLVLLLRGPPRMPTAPPLDSWASVVCGMPVGLSLGLGEPQGIQRGGLVAGVRAGDLLRAGELLGDLLKGAKADGTGSSSSSGSSGGNTVSGTKEHSGSECAVPNCNRTCSNDAAQ